MLNLRFRNGIRYKIWFRFRLTDGVRAKDRVRVGMVFGVRVRFPLIKEGRKEMLYLTTHSTHFYLRLYGVGHMVKNHSDSERGNPLPPHRLLLLIKRVLLYAPSHRQDRTYQGLCFTSRGALAGT